VLVCSRSSFSLSLFPFPFPSTLTSLQYPLQSSPSKFMHTTHHQFQGLMNQASHTFSSTSASRLFSVRSKTWRSLRRRRKSWCLMIFLRRTFRGGRGRLGLLVRSHVRSKSWGFGGVLEDSMCFRTIHEYFSSGRALPPFPRAYAICESEPILIRAGINFCSVRPYEPTPHKSVDYRAFRLRTTTEGIIEIFAQ
jgi:hypothetical protein